MALIDSSAWIEYLRDTNSGPCNAVDDLVRGDRRGDLVARGADREIGRIGDARGGGGRALPGRLHRPGHEGVG